MVHSCKSGPETPGLEQTVHYQNRRADGPSSQPLIAAHHTTTLDNASSSKPRVLLSFNITSTASTFNCDPLDELRRHGVFPGLYSCNGNTIDVPSGSIGKGGGRSLLGVAMGLMVAGLLIVI